MILTLPAARWTQKPLPGTDLDRTHAYCPDHCWPFLGPQGTAQCLARHAPLKAPSTRGDIYTGSSKLVATGKYGLAVRHGAQGDTLRFTADDAAEVDKVAGTNAHTLLLCYRKTDTTLRVASPFGVNGSTGTDWYGVQGIQHSAGFVYWRYGGITEGTSQLSLANGGLTFGDDLWIFTTGLRGMEIWQNGLLRGSNSGTPSRTTAAGDHIYSPCFVPSNSDLADIALVMSWRRQLPAAAVRALSVNPWQVFQPRTVLVVTAAAAAPVTKLNTLLLAP